MGALIFLALALLVSVVGCGILWWQHRTPNTVDSGIEAFRREMDALAPPDAERGTPDEGR
jgi:hypothetical protein